MRDEFRRLELFGKSYMWIRRHGVLSLVRDWT